MTAYVSTGLPPDQVFPAMRDAVRKLDPNLPVYSMKTMEETRDDSIGKPLVRPVRLEEV
jgi:hypothetical protein